MAGAIVFAILAWILSELVKPLLPEGLNVGNFSEYNIIIGIICGWVVMGPRAIGGYAEALGGGVTTSIVMLAWGLLIYSVIEMVKQSFRMHYKGPIEAVVGIFEIGFGYGAMLGTVGFITTLIAGGALCGLACGWVAKRWK